MRSDLFVRQSNITTNHKAFIPLTRHLWTRPLPHQMPRIGTFALLPQPHRVMGIENSAQISAQQLGNRGRGWN